MEVKKKTKDQVETPKHAKIANKSKNTKNVAATSQSPTQGNIIQQSAGQSHAQSSSEPHSAAFTPPAVPANPALIPATVPVTPAPATVTLEAGCWTLFLLRIGCVSVPHAGGHR